MNTYTTHTHSTNFTKKIRAHGENQVKVEERNAERNPSVPLLHFRMEHHQTNPKYLTKKERERSMIHCIVAEAQQFVFCCFFLGYVPKLQFFSLFCSNNFLMSHDDHVGTFLLLYFYVICYCTLGICMMEGEKLSSVFFW